MPKPSTSPTRAKTGEGVSPPHPHPTEPDDEADGNDASTLIENPVKPPQPGEASKLKQHTFPDGGGSGGAEAFRRGPRKGKPSPGV
ncbi:MULTISPECIES: hypothetical protein [unclassified Polaromonas]|jgi:hypothetical protein|uniref:hypothetical protein n=1 Tax=unclassified Polaromonas TaxID=2638319 RepID=UPI000F089796|nr:MULTISPECIES: hypothetical protein [unclassified Polaromonas]AYQ29254.1 hypothetical protein DT070_15210 [Polaromonas sp. SP1]QGJ19633.1 hypothetical protein F7R28_15390 [Polaromonas sp. Pch-P]